MLDFKDFFKVKSKLLIEVIKYVNLSYPYGRYTCMQFNLLVLNILYLIPKLTVGQTKKSTRYNTNSSKF